MKKNHLKLFMISLASIAIIIPAVNVGRGIYIRLSHYSEGGWIDIELPAHIPVIEQVDYTNYMDEKNPVYPINGRKLHLVAGYLGKEGAKVIIDTKINDKNDCFYRIEMTLSKGNNWEQDTYRFIQTGNAPWQIEMQDMFGKINTYPLNSYTSKIEKIAVHKNSL